MLPDKSVAIDEEGYGVLGELRLNDIPTGQELLKNLALSETGAWVSRVGGVPALVEPFDEPLVAAMVEKKDSKWVLDFPYEWREAFDPARLRLDEWDRFHGYTERGLPFVMSRKAQARFFEIIDDSDDESIEIDGKTYDVPAYWAPHSEVEKEKYWTQIYHDEGKPGWDLGAPAEALKDMLPRLRLRRCRVLVLGCGEGHDAAFFARAGHFVTGVDLSPEAIARARKTYGDIPNLRFEERDALKLPPEFDHAFDVVFEHTFYCAINPEKRQELVKTWNRCLAPEGHLMGVFFAMEKPNGPPYGGSEWELRQRLGKSYQPIFWGRWKTSLPRRQGKEFFVYMKKI